MSKEHKREPDTYEKAIEALNRGKLEFFNEFMDNPADRRALYDLIQREKKRAWRES